MSLIKQNIEAKTDLRLIPQWVKAAITFFTASAGVIFGLSLYSLQETLWNLSTELIIIGCLGLTLLLILITAAFWFSPNGAFPLFLYWCIRFLREQICMFALLGMGYLLIARAELFSYQGGIPLLNLIILFLVGLFVPPVGADHVPFAWMKRSAASAGKLINKINSVPTWIFGLVVAVLPIIIICSVIYLGLNSSLSAYRPYSFWNDETGYWLWVRSFSHVSFNVGYNAPNELVAPASFNHYGEGSPFYVYIYGAIGRWVGWSPQLPLLINFAILAVAIFLFIHFTNLDPTQTIFICLITVVTWPILLYLPMTTHETLNQAIGFILAIVFLKLLINREQISLPARISFIVLVYLATLIRLSWGLLLIPVIFYSMNGGILRRILLSVLLGSGLYVSTILITGYLVPPAANSIFMNIKGSLVHGPQVFIKYLAWQFSWMFGSGQLTPNIAVMFQIAIIISWNMIRLVRLVKSKLSASSILQSRSVFDIYNMATLTVAGLLFYLQVGFFRTFAPSMLIVYLMQAARKDYKLLVMLLTINVLFFYSYITFFDPVGGAQIIKADFTAEFPQRAQVQAEIERWVAFDATTQNPWCNTLLIPLRYYDYRLTVVPPGIGISWFQEGTVIKMPLHSKYLLFDQETYEQLKDNLNVKLLESSSIGDLYYNLDSGCAVNQ